MAVTVTQVAVTTFSTTPSATISSTPAAGDVVVLFIPSNTTTGRTITSVSGLGATWTITDFSATMAASVAIGTGATTSGSITFTPSVVTQSTLRAYLVSGLGPGYSQSIQSAAQASTTGTLNGPSNSVAAGAIVIEFLNSNKGGATTTWTRTGYTTDANGIASNAANITASSAYVIPGSSGTQGTSMSTSTASASRLTQVILTPAAGSTTADVAATLPALTGAAAATSTVTATAAATLPSLTASAAGVATIPAAAAATLPSLSASVAAASTVTATGAATLPSLTADVLAVSDDTTFADVSATLPALTGSVAATSTATEGVAATLPALTASIAADVTEDGTSFAEVGATLPALSAAVDVDNAAEAVVSCIIDTPDGILVSVPLVPVTPLAAAVPITRVSVLAPNLSAEYPAHPAPGMEGAPEVVEEVVGYPQLFIGGRNVTNLRDVQTVVRRWRAEAPFCDTAAAFEFPQKNPWDKPGVGDFDFLTRDARVAIGMREETAPGVFSIRRLWSGFLDARGSGLGDSEDYFFEAKGTFWQAASQIREPHSITDPVDIGVWIARVLNAVEGRRWATMPLTPIGIKTNTRGSRDQYVMDYVQELLSEAITDDYRQWSLVEIIPGVPRLVLKPAPSTVHATVAYGTPGVDIALRVDESTRVDRVFMRGIGRNNGGWANITYPWIGELNAAPPYPMADPGDDITLGATDADTVTGAGVTDFQRRVDELEGFANPAVSGTMSAAWMAVVDDLQRRLGVAVGPLNEETWERVFDGRPNPEALKPRRLPMASKPEAEKYLYTVEGKRLPGVNPAWDGRVPRDIAIDGGVGLSKAEGFKLARKILGMFGEPAHNGSITWETDPRETDRTRLTHLSNVKVTGYEGEDVVVQVSSVEVELDTGREDGPAYVVTTRVDERARDAMVVEDLLDQRREAKADPSRRPGVTNRSSRQVSDQRMPWDSESVCGRLRRTHVTSSHWKIVVVPFAEVGKLARIELESDQPFAFAILASLRITGNKMDSIVGAPFVGEKWRDAKDLLDAYGIIEAWGEQGEACGYSPKTESSGAPFTGKFELDTPIDYWTETPPGVAIALRMRSGSGYISGRFIPAFET